MRRTFEVLGVCALTAMFLGNVFAQAPEGTPAKEVPAEEHTAAQIAEDVRQLLHQPVTLELANIPIRDAIGQLLTPRKIDFWFDEASINEASVSLDETEVSCRLHHASMRAGLKRILDQANLSWVCEDTGIYITTAAKAMQRRFSRVYDVAELIEAPVVEVEGSAANTQQASQFGGQIPSRDQKPQPDAKVGPETNLIRLIQQLTGGIDDGGSWMDVDGEGGSIHFLQTANSNLLVVRQNEQVQAQIEDLLNDLISHQLKEDGAIGPVNPKTAVRTRVRLPARNVVKQHPRMIPAH